MYQYHSLGVTEGRLLSIEFEPKFDAIEMANVKMPTKVKMF